VPTHCPSAVAIDSHLLCTGFSTTDVDKSRLGDVLRRAQDHQARKRLLPRAPTSWAAPHPRVTATRATG
jgi:hypothetical protein